MNRPTRYTRAVIICHGKSEIIFIESIKSNLKLPISTFSHDRGKSSIQITSLMSYLNKPLFKNLKEFAEEYSIEHSKNKLINFKLFIIMDLDDQKLYPNNIKKYKNKEMFKGHPLYDYIVPIYNDPNLDDVLTKLGYNVNPNNKVQSYNKIFPGNNGDYKEFQQIKQKFQNSTMSNMIELLLYLNECYKIIHK